MLTCLICKDPLAVFKGFNVKTRHETRHSNYLEFDAELRKYKLASLKSQLKARKKILS